MKKSVLRITILLLVSIVIISLSGCNDIRPRVSKENSLQGYIKAVYAPDDMDEFNSAKEDAIKHLFTEDAAKRFFVKYEKELNEIDKTRRVDSYVVHGEAKNQSDNVERYLADVYMMISNQEIVPHTITFMLNSKGKIYDFVIY